MSWDLFVQQLPDVKHASEIPSGFQPGPLGPRAAIIDGIRDVFPDVDFSDPTWGSIDRDAFTVEVNIAADDPVTGFGLHVRGGEDAAAAVTALLAHLGFRAIDPQSDGGIFDPAAGADSHQRWQRYGDQLVDRDTPSD